MREKYDNDHSTSLQLCLFPRFLSAVWVLQALCSHQTQLSSSISPTDLRVFYNCQLIKQSPCRKFHNAHFKVRKLEQRDCCLSPINGKISNRPPESHRPYVLMKCTHLHYLEWNYFTPMLLKRIFTLLSPKQQKHLSSQQILCQCSSPQQQKETPLRDSVLSCSPLFSKAFLVSTADMVTIMLH